MTTTAPPRQLRVAIYCRQSVASDLEFGSIQAQREAVEAYVLSQRGEGWVALATRYEDHGFSGSTVDRPAFQQLIADIGDGKVDTIAAYKIDRVSRSLADFTRFMTLLERHGVGFVSTTQAFDTRTSMGRLTLNILASFSQFERETIAERVRDKMQATRRRGEWTGGRPILGYDVVNKKLVVNHDEARQVHAIFDLYLAHGSLRETIAELRRRGWRNKTFIGKTGRQFASCEFTKATLHGLLTSVLYRGQVRCKDGVVQGVHEPIVDAELFDAVQAQLRGNGKSGGAQTKNKTGATLRGLVQCGRCGSPMLHTFTTKDQRRYRFYCCSRAHNEGVAACPDARVAAGPFEQFVANQISTMGKDEVLLAKTAASVAKLDADRREQLGDELRILEQRRRQAVRAGDQQQLHDIEQKLAEARGEGEALGNGAVDIETLRAALDGFQPVWTELFPAEQERILRLLIERVTYDPDGGNVDIKLRACGIESLAAEAI